MFKVSVVYTLFVLQFLFAAIPANRNAIPCFDGPFNL